MWLVSDVSHSQQVEPDAGQEVAHEVVQEVEHTSAPLQELPFSTVEVPVSNKSEIWMLFMRQFVALCGSSLQFPAILSSINCQRPLSARLKWCEYQISGLYSGVL
ncbi:MAG: hypothetical protein HKN85_04255 [Gammaproteobacteria bacterium]|nr:hypothetical protein [Gammaproteobacteria bacterium]